MIRFDGIGENSSPAISNIDVSGQYPIFQDEKLSVKNFQNSPRVLINIKNRNEHEV